MLPTKLFLRNFMCYRDNVPPLHFDGIHLACLSGDNGNGKSALIDAITWALWGRSRAKSDDELIHLGKNDMEVEFDFVVGEAQYRVIRKRTKARPKTARSKTERPGQTLLEFQVASEEGFKSISGDSVAQTQQKIIHTLHMDYPTFVNSAYLRQGHDDEFTIKPPGERKKVLADILGLSFYDGLEERAKNRVREKEQQQSALESAIQEMQQEIGRREEHEAALGGVRAELSELEKKLANQESQVNILREKKKALDFKREQLIELEKTTERARGEQKRWEGRLAEHTRKVESYQTAIQQAPAVKEGYARLQEARREMEGLDMKLQQSFALTKRKDGLVQVINESRGKKLEERGRVQSKAEELEARVRKIARLEQDLSATRTKYDMLAQREKELGEKKQEVQQLAIEIQYLTSAKAKLAQELKESKEKLALLTGGDARCPLCETELGAEGKQRIEEKFRAEIKAKMDGQRQNEVEIKEKTGQHQEVSRHVGQLESKLNQERLSVQRQVASLEKEISLGKEAEIELPEVRKRQARIDEQLSKGEFAITEQQALVEVEQQIAGLGYDAAKHQQVQALVAELGKYENLQRQLEEAERNLPFEKIALNEAKEAIAGWESALKADREKAAALTAEIASLPGLANELRQAEEAHNTVRRQQTEVRDRMVALQERLARCSELEEKRREKEQSLLKTLKEKGIYEELAQAFGKKGIQAFLIESALPEIEEEANSLLGRMTGGRMQVNIDTQRETKKGETVETLDIKIRDELGDRSYEMYSGGEAFRINLALRIALSKLLARRAGAPLPTLFIDEGFGTQDSSGLGKLVEAINSIQDDFKMIIVITHLEELKEAFPVRIEVTKTSEGSQISLS
ncbi:MAG: SMC family ATPase [Chloroflexi bacterium]|nr:SMC family ATPase [Chloroflexota bacterium]